MITFIIWFYLVSCLLFNVLFLWYDSRDGVTVEDLLMTILLSLIPLINTFGIFWILHQEGVSSKVVFKRNVK